MGSPISTTNANLVVKPLKIVTNMDMHSVQQGDYMHQTIDHFSKDYNLLLLRKNNTGKLTF